MYLLGDLWPVFVLLLYFFLFSFLLIFILDFETCVYT
jgi:hypothetical protein